MEVSISRSVLDRVVDAIDQTTYSRDFPISFETRLSDDLKLSRIGRIKFGMRLEEIFSLELSDDVLAQAVTVGNVVDYLSKHYFRDMDFACGAEEADDITQSAGVLIRLDDSSGATIRNCSNSPMTSLPNGSWSCG